MSKTIQIVLRPLDYYFFGTNETFDFAAKGVKNFSVKSNPLPQQTGLLGLLRHALFLAGYEIGNSFNHGLANHDFGSIKAISPLYLTNNDSEVLYKCPIPLQETNTADVISPSFNVSGTGAVYNNRHVYQTFSAVNYNPKKEWTVKWININTGEKVDDSHLFAKETHIGIDKEKTNKKQTDEGAFYKQEFYRLSNAAIAFQATVDDSVDISKLPLLLPFGGEKKMFSICYTADGFLTWESIREKATDLFKEYLPGPVPSIMLLTDTYVRDIEELEASISYAVLQAKPFRNIRTPKTVSDFSRLGSIAGDDKQLYKPEETTYILKQGSVLFPDGQEKKRIIEMLTHNGFSTIGYNQFISNF
ncbi:MAG TPA: type III-B CRISPR module-associated Cmr3 family protein [Chitinophagaceae bacterium]|nr:type III-B CRISPR module-associated Cmr3 family protein [Chitinophagaceae bacterium]